MKNKLSVDTMSQMSVDSSTSSESKDPIYFAASDIRRRLTENVEPPKKKFEVSSPRQRMESSGGEPPQAKQTYTLQYIYFVRFHCV